MPFGLINRRKHKETGQWPVSGVVIAVFQNSPVTWCSVHVRAG